MMNFDSTISFIKSCVQSRFRSFNVVFDPQGITDMQMLGEYLLSEALSYQAGDNYDLAGDAGWYGISDYTMEPAANGMRYNFTWYDTAGAVQQIMNRRKTLLEQSPVYPNEPPLDLIRRLFLYLARNCQYDATLTTDGLFRNGIYDCLINQRAVCQGFAATMAFLLDGYQDALEVRMIQGYEVSNLQFYPHCINLVKYNGVSYFIDLTAAVHLHDSDSDVTDAELLRFCMTVHGDFNNKVLTDYLQLPNFLRLEFLRKYPIASESIDWTT